MKTPDWLKEREKLRDEAETSINNLISERDDLRVRVRQLEEENRKLTEEVRIWKHNPENEQAVIVSDATEAAFTARLEARQLKEERDSLQSQRDELERVVETCITALNSAVGMCGHDHWDHTLQSGLGCHLCIKQREIMEGIRNTASQARAALGKGAVDSAPQSAHTPNKEKT